MANMDGTVSMTEETNGNVLILRIKGRLDAISSPSTEKMVFDYINNGHSNLLLDFEGVNYLSSAGMRMLLSTSKKLKALDGKLVLCSLTTNVMDILKMSGFDHVIELSNSEQDALKKFTTNKGWLL